MCFQIESRTVFNKCSSMSIVSKLVDVNNSIGCIKHGVCINCTSVKNTDLLASFCVGVETTRCIVVWPMKRLTIRRQPPTTKLQKVCRIVGSGSKLEPKTTSRLKTDTKLTKRTQNKNGHRIKTGI